MLGDGYSSVLRCEYADDPEIDYAAPDEKVFYCDFVDVTKLKKKLDALIKQHRGLEDSAPAYDVGVIEGQLELLKEIL